MAGYKIQGQTYQVVESISAKKRTSDIMVFNNDKEFQNYLNGRRTTNAYNTRYSIVGWKVKNTGEGSISLRNYGYKGY